MSAKPRQNFPRACLGRLLPAPIGSAKDWPEDAEHENGKYWCECIKCAGTFIGHKRRIICKVCAAPPNVPAQRPPDTDV